MTRCGRCPAAKLLGGLPTDNAINLGYVPLFVCVFEVGSWAWLLPRSLSSSRTEELESIPSHPIPSHPIPSHPIPSHPIPSMYFVHAFLNLSIHLSVFIPLSLCPFIHSSLHPCTCTQLLPLPSHGSYSPPTKLLCVRLPCTKIRLVHRLDYATGGLMLAATSKKAAAEAWRLFKERRVAARTREGGGERGRSGTRTPRVHFATNPKKPHPKRRQQKHRLKKKEVANRPSVSAWMLKPKRFGHACRMQRLL